MSNARAIGLFLLLNLLTCALFAATASFALAAAAGAGVIDQPPSFLVRTCIKAFGFLVMALVAAFAIRRTGRLRESTTPIEREPAFSPGGWLALLALLAVAAALLLPRLNTYPYPEPDELHHLVVARNLAVHGDYASGHRATGLIHFDSYDSVGPPVILPVAASFKVLGVSLVAGRLPIAVSFLALLVLLVLLFRPLMDAPASLLGGLVVLIAWGSIYLGRSLYGEAPALLFFVAALLLWRRSLTNHPWLYAALAGLALGLATLSKSILLLTAFPFAVVVLYDWFTARRLALPHVVMPALGVIAVQALWGWYTATDGQGGTFGMYQHNLMFGFTSVLGTFRWVAWTHAFYFVPAAIGLLLLAPRVMRDHDPAIRVACLTAILYAFWWCFFTNGHIPRYLWISIAILAFPLAHVLRELAGLVLDRRTPALRIAALVLVIAIVAPFAPLMKYELERIAGDEHVMRGEQELLAVLAGMPRNATVATTWWPLERWSHFFLDRPMPVVIDVAAAVSTHDAVVTRAGHEGALLIPGVEALRIGQYIVYRKEP